jgi:phage tail tape-measure protein
MNTLNSKAIAAGLLLAASLAVTGCATANGQQNTLKKGAMGAAAGAIAGAIIGNNAGDGDAQSGALIGAVIGGAGGAYAGCRDDGGCGNEPSGYPSQNQGYQTQGYQQQAPAPVIQAVNKRQFYEQQTGRYYYYDPATKMEYYENGQRKYN